MQFLYKLSLNRPEIFSIGPNDDEMKIINAHTDYLETLSKQGEFIMFGRTQVDNETSFGLVVFSAESEILARQIMENDPAVKNGLMTAELHPYKVEYLNRSYHD